MFIDIYKAFMPESILLLSILIFTSVFPFIKGIKESVYIKYTLIAVVVAIIFLLMSFNMPDYYAFWGSIVAGRFSVCMKILVLFSTLVSLFIFSRDKNIPISNTGPFCVLLLCASFGAMLACSANDLISVFLGIETLSLSCFALSGLYKTTKSLESSLKYLISGATASAVMLYGISFIYGITSNTNFTSIFQNLSHIKPSLPMFFGIVLLLSGLCFKLAAVPFHAWFADVSEGAPPSVATFVSTAAKVAGIAVIIKLMYLFSTQSGIASIFLSFIAAFTMSVGNLLAIGQNNLRRFIAYSSVAQAGYILAVLSVTTFSTAASAVFYLAVYVLMTLLFWFSFSIFFENSNRENITDLKGLIYSQPVLAILFVISILSLAGFPLTAGFIGKFYLFKTILFAGKGFILLFAFALINTLVGVYYYINVVRNLFKVTDYSSTSKPLAIPLSVYILALLIILFGILPNPLLYFVVRSVQYIGF